MIRVLRMTGRVYDINGCTYVRRLGAPDVRFLANALLPDLYVWTSRRRGACAHHLGSPYIGAITGCRMDWKGLPRS